jgi:anti-sigma factor RsiW
MAPHVSEQEWMDYLSGTLDREKASRVRHHADTCPECAALLAELSSWHRSLTGEGARMREALKLPPAEMDRFLERSMERIRVACPEGIQAARRRTASEGLFLLRSLIEPIFGSGTARVVIDLAVRRCTVGPSPELSSREWPLFVNNLSESLASIGGSAAARLVNRAGIALVDEAA